MTKVNPLPLGGNEICVETQDYPPAAYDLTQHPQLGRFDAAYEASWHLQSGRRPWRVVATAAAENDGHSRP